MCLKYMYYVWIVLAPETSMLTYRQFYGPYAHTSKPMVFQEQ